MKKMTIGFHPMEHKKNSITKMTPLYIRLLSNGKKIEARLPKEYDLTDYDLKKWNKFQQRIDSKDSDINDYLNSISIRKKKLDIDSLLMDSFFTEKDYINKLLNRFESSKEEKEPTLYEYAKKYLRQEIEPSKKKEGTKKNYRNAINQLCLYLEFCGYKELPISEFKFTHANGFKKFLESDIKSLEKQKIVTNYHHPFSFLGAKEKNSVVSSSTKIKNVKPIFRHAINEELITRNPFEGVELIFEGEETNGLNIHQIRRVFEIELTTDSGLQFAKDIFLFMCFTGLSISDALELSTNEIEIVQNPSEYIIFYTHRNKTKQKIGQILCKYATDIMYKYLNANNGSKRVFPSETDVSINRKLKTLGLLAKIPFSLITKNARVSFKTLLREAGIRDFILIRRLMGWSNRKFIEHVYDRFTDNDFLLIRDQIDTYLKMYLKSDET